MLFLVLMLECHSRASVPDFLVFSLSLTPLKVSSKDPM